MNKRGFPFLILALLLLTAGTMGVAQAQVTPYPVTLTMSGPATAVSGQEITYRVHYQIFDLPSTDIVIRVTPGATYVSTRVVSGPEGNHGEPGERRVRWGFRAKSDGAEGIVEFVVRADDGFSGTLFADAYVPGTMTTSSNVVETEVFATGTLPEAGGGGAVSRPGLPMASGLLALSLVGAALLGGGTVIRLLNEYSLLTDGGVTG